MAPTSLGASGQPRLTLPRPGPAASQCSTVCSINSSSLLLCRSPAVPDGASPRRVFFALDNVHVDFARASGGQDFLYTSPTPAWPRSAAPAPTASSQATSWTWR